MFIILLLLLLCLLYYYYYCYVYYYYLCITILISFCLPIYSSATSIYNTYLRLNRAPLVSVAKIYVTNCKIVVHQCTTIYDDG